MKGPTREVNLEPEIAANTGLGGDPVVEVSSNSTSEDSHEATGSIPAIEVSGYRNGYPVVSPPPLRVHLKRLSGLPEC